ncbi:MAG: tRNA (guanosine(46)-N7)-methyltransferase TrmB [Lachnospiraceae bacterium]|nr:tRNA (guanosine(46)-N7)-methyltransferase TrmB [Lachnospiraceae bacterium]
MRLRHIKGAEEMIAANRFVIQTPDEFRGIWSKEQPLHIEIGTGKGRFIMTLAEQNPDIKYLGIENHSSVLLRAVQKLEQQELPNLRFILMDAVAIDEIFAPGEVDKIYLNFSDPWPKDRHAKRRLPSRQFLERFNNILKSDGTIEFKTDNRVLFDFALEELEYSDFELVAKTYDLHADASMNEGNIMTEYEEKFSSLGNPICKYIIKKKAVSN